MNDAHRHPPPRRAPRPLVALLVAAAAAWLASGLARALRPQPPPDRVGACSLYATCRDASCHISYPLGSTTLVPSLALEGGAPLPTAYVPGRTYALRLDVDDTQSPEASAWGFEIASFTECATAVPLPGGSIAAVDAGRTVVTNEDGVDYLSHRCTCPTDDPWCCGYIPESSPGLIGWSLLWTAPSRGSGDVTFNMAFNAANHDGTPLNDRISLAEVLLPEEPCPPPVRDLRVRKQACEPSAPGETRLELSWTTASAGAPLVRVASTRAELEAGPTTWPDAATTCLPLGPEPLRFISLAERCSEGSEGPH
jgi:hypothetical protein